jgi:hypothetical protein
MANGLWNSPYYRGWSTDSILEQTRSVIRAKSGDTLTSHSLFHTREQDAHLHQASQRSKSNTQQADEMNRILLVTVLSQKFGPPS